MQTSEGKKLPAEFKFPQLTVLVGNFVISQVLNQSRKIAKKLSETKVFIAKKKKSQSPTTMTRCDLLYLSYLLILMYTVFRHPDKPSTHHHSTYTFSLFFSSFFSFPSIFFALLSFRTSLRCFFFFFFCFFSLLFISLLSHFTLVPSLSVRSEDALSSSYFYFDFRLPPKPSVLHLSRPCHRPARPLPPSPPRRIQPVLVVSSILHHTSRLVAFPLSLSAFTSLE